MSFALHPRLAADTAPISDWPLSRVLLMNDRRFPWLILVPRRNGITELFDLSEPDRAVLSGEIARAGERLKAFAKGRGPVDKINIGAIGNLVPQLHIHVVARARGDAAWPGVVWGFGQAEPYRAAELAKTVADLRDSL
jgi:diadenosine tetraphosphate (Ap4A) HIT family hydrolase